MSTLFIVASVAWAIVCVNALTVHLVPHTHDDVGWLKTVDQYYMGSQNNIQHAGVQYVLDSVNVALTKNPNRTFVYVEQAFFQRWWRQQNAATQNTMRAHINRGAFVFINGGWCMHDEGASHYIDLIDQTALGHKFILDQFGAAANPRIGWQIDTFGHSATHISLLSAQVGFDATYFGRLDWQEHDQRIARQDLEWVWRASDSLGPANQIFTGAFQSGNYGPPDGMCWDYFCSDQPIQDDPRLEDYNVQSRVDDFVSAAYQQAKGTRGDVETMNLMWTMGSDFMYENANLYFKNMDKIIEYVNKDARVKAMYSDPYKYTLAKNAEPNQWSLRTSDALPYASSQDNYWTGYFTSRPSLKRYVRSSSILLQIGRQWEVNIAGRQQNALTSPLFTLWDALAIAQHHDAVSGTERQAVADDYILRIFRGVQDTNAYLEQLIANWTVVNSHIAPPTFITCPLANVSVCPPAQSITQADDTVAVLVYNPLARSVRRRVSIPFNGAAASVIDGRIHSLIPSQVMSVMKTIATQNDSAPNAVSFIAELPPVGYNTYFITTTRAAVSRATSEQHRMQTMAEPERHQRLSKPLASLQQSRSASSQQINTLPLSADVSITNDYWKLNFDSRTGLLSSVTSVMSGRQIPFNQSFYWYPSNQAPNTPNSEAYIFRPNVSTAEPIPLVEQVVSLEVVSGSLTSEVRQVFNSWASQVVRLTLGSPVIEFEFVVGHIDTSDGQGKEIVTRYGSNIASGGVWFTDSNGREMQRRVRNQRTGFDWNYHDEPVSGNFYPANALAWLTDDQLGFAVINDRSQGATSLHDGSLEFMLHRRLVLAVGGTAEALNELDADGRGLTITGKHHLIIAEAANISAHARHIQSLVYAEPHITYTAIGKSSSIDKFIQSHVINKTFINGESPANLELITMQAWNPGSVLIRIAHMFGTNEDAVLQQPVDVDLLIYSPTRPESIAELSLTANAEAGTNPPLNWNTTSAEKHKAVDQYTRKTLQPGTTIVTINPMEVRTFLYSYQQT